MIRPILLHGRKGFGDAIYSRSAVAAKAHASPDELYLATPWPQLFADLPIRMLPLPSRLTWSEKNIQRQPPETWAERPAAVREVDYRYQWHTLRTHSMPEQMAARLGVQVSRFTLPALPPCPVPPGRIAVIRPVTGRNDWMCTARNPIPGYMNEAARLLSAEGYHVISVAAITSIEPYIGEPPQAHTRFDNAELAPLELLALVRAASLVVTGPGWLVPAALACGTPLVVLAGGCGALNGPQALVPKWYQGRVTWLKPPKFCQCNRREHNCPKEIPDFGSRFREALAFERQTAVGVL